VQDLGLLYDALVPGAVGYTIDAQEDALTVITRLLTQTGARRLAVVAHGEPGVVQIGAQTLNRKQLRARSHLLQEWGVEEIALYSCEVGKDVSFIAELERLTGATVAAATGKVGSAEQSGSWDVGNSSQFKGNLPFTLQILTAWNHSLPITGATITSLSNDTGSSNSDFITNAGSQTVTFTISGTKDSGTQIQISVDGGRNWTTATLQAGTTNTYTMANVTLQPGTNFFQVRERTQGQGQPTTVFSSGNLSSYTLDQTSPTAPTITSIGGSDSTVSGVANDNQVVGTAEANSTVRVFFGATQLGTATADAQGNWTYTLTSANLTAIGQGGSKNITATATDVAGNNSGSGTAFTLSVDTVAPSALSFSSTNIAENNTPNAVVATLSATDSSAVTYSLVTGTGDTDNSTFTISGNQLRLNNSANFEGKGSYSVRIRATDAAGNFTETTQTINVTDVNEAPTAITLSANPIAENAAGAVIGTLTVTDPDTAAAFRNNTLTVSDDRFEVVNGQLKLKAGQSLNYESLTNGQLTVTVTATDSTLPAGSNSVSQAFTINVTDVNEAPVLSGTAASLSAGSEDSAYTISAADLLEGFTDADGDKLSVSGLSATNGTISANADGTYTFTPNANFNGSVSLTYNVIDGKGGTVAASQSFSVAAVNDAPTGTATATLVDGTEDTPYIISAEALLSGFSDVEGDSLSVADLTATNGTIFANADGTYTFTPADNYNGSVSLTYNVIDGNGGTVAATQSFSITSVNDAPTGTASATLATGTEDTPYTIKASDLLAGFSDVDNVNLSVSDLTASNGTISANADGSYTFTPDANYNGSVSLTYNVIDGNGGTVAATQSFSLAAVNDAPTGTASATLATGTEDTPYTIKASDLLAGFSDVDGDKLSVAELSATNGTITNNADGSYTFTPDANYNGSVNLTYNVVDGNGGTVAASQSFSITSVNDAPTGTATATLATGVEDTPYIISAADLLAGFSDVDGDSLSVAELTASNGSLADNGDGTYTFTPADNYNGSVNLTYNVIDGNGGTVAASQSFSITSVNDPPTGTASATLATGTEDTPYIITATDLLAGFSDVDNVNLSVYDLTASNGDITDNGDGSYTFTPDANYNGSVSLTYNVIDGNGGTVAATQSFSITSVNDAPTGTASATLATGTEDTPYTIKASDLLAGFSDVDNVNLSVSDLTASNGTISANADGSYTFTPDANYNGSVSLTYNVIDGNGGTVAATQSFSLAAVNDAPTGTASATLATGTEDTPYTIKASDLLAGFSDVDNVNLSVSDLTASNGTISANADGSYTFTPDANYNGSVSLDLQRHRW
jgi:hypothetical protein